MPTLPHKLSGVPVQAGVPIMLCLPGFPDDTSAFDEMAKRWG